MEPSSERRSCPRYPVDSLLFFLNQDQGLRGAGFLANVSQGGAFLQTTDFPRIGELIEVSLKSNNSAIPVVLGMGEVVRCVNGLEVKRIHWGFGLKWRSLLEPGKSQAVDQYFEERRRESQHRLRTPDN